MNETAPGSGGLPTVDLPLRGLASEGASERIGPPLRAIPGVLEVAVLASEFRVRVTYDPERVTPETIQEALHGIASPDTAHDTAHGSVGVPTHQAPGGGGSDPGDALMAS